MQKIIVTFVILFASTSFAGLSDNKKIVTEFYKMAFVDHLPAEAANRFIGDHYIQHNPFVGDGKKPFIDYFVPFFKKNPDSVAEIKAVFAEADVVILHVLSKQNKSDRGASVVDFFRIENEKIVEHWDVRQEIPEKSANSNSMF